MSQDVELASPIKDTDLLVLTNCIVSKKKQQHRNCSDEDEE